VLEAARAVARLSPFTVKMFRRTLALMASPLVLQSIQEEAVTESMVFASHDYREKKAARAEQRDPR
jgi:hypothetical protein